MTAKFARRACVRRKSRPLLRPAGGLLLLVGRRPTRAQVERRARLEQMDANDRERLSQNYERFSSGL